MAARKKSNLERFGAQVRRFRGARGLRGAAQEIGTSAATLSRLERAVGPPDIGTLRAVLTWMGEKDPGKKMLWVYADARPAPSRKP